MTLAKIKYLSNTYFKFDFVKLAGWNRRAGENFFSKSINVQTKIRPCRGEFFLKINKRACTSIWYTRVYECSLNNKKVSIHSFWYTITCTTCLTFFSQIIWLFYTILTDCKLAILSIQYKIFVSEFKSYLFD